MLPMGWNQIRQSRMPNQQQLVHANTMGHQQQQQFNGHPHMNQHHMMGHNQQPQQFDVYHQQQFMHQQQQHQMFQHQMMTPYQMVPPKPPEPQEPPPPSPRPPLPKDEPQPKPPKVEAQWWVAEIQNLSSYQHRSELERLSSEKWFQSMTTSQQIECWQHKMQLISKGKGGMTTPHENSAPQSQSESANPVPISAPFVSAPSPLRKSDLPQSGDVDSDLEKARIEEKSIQQQVATFERQYGEWKKQFDDWKEKHKAHPNKEQFAQYENQWMTWQKQMSDQKKQYDDNLGTIRSQITDLEQRKSQQLQQQSLDHDPFNSNSQRQYQQNELGNRPGFQEDQMGNHPGFQEDQMGNHPGFQEDQMGQPGEQFDPNQDYEQMGHDGPSFDNQQEPGPRFTSNQRHRFGFNQGSQPRFEGGHRPRFDGHRPQRLRFGGDRGSGFDHDEGLCDTEQPIFSAPGGVDNSHFQHPTPGVGPRHRHPGPGRGGNFRGPRPRFGGNRARFDNSGWDGDEWHGGGDPSFRGERFPNPEAQDQDEENEDYDENPQQDEMFQNQHVRGPRPRFRGGGRGGLQDRLMGMAQQRSKFGGPNQRQQRPRGRGMDFDGLRFRGPRPRFPGRQQQRFPGPRGLRPPLFLQQQNFDNDESFAEDDFEDDGTFRNFSQDEETSEEPEQKGPEQEPAKEEKGKKAKEEWNINRSMLPMSFGFPEGKKHSDLMETFTVHDAKGKKMQPKKAVKEELEDMQNEFARGKKQKPEDDYSHYMADDYAKFDEPKTFNQGFGRGRGRGRGVQNRGRGRERGNAFSERYLRGDSSAEEFELGNPVKPPHLLIKEMGGFSRERLEKIISSTHRGKGRGETHQSTRDGLEHGATPERRRDDSDSQSEPTTPAIDSKAVLRKAKELSNLDIKNLLSVVKSLKSSTTEQQAKEKSKEPISEPIPSLQPSARRNEQYKDAETEPDVAGDPLDRHYDKLARDLRRGASPLRDSLALNDRLTEADLLAAGLDPVSLGLRDEDLLIQDYLLGAGEPLMGDSLMRDPMFDPLLRDPYLEREILLREMQDREAVRRETELRQKLARPVLQAQKIVETIDYSHGLNKGKEDERNGQDPDGRPRDLEGPLDRGRDLRGPYGRDYPERGRFPPGREELEFARGRYPPGLDERMRMMHRDGPPGMDNRFRVMDQGRRSRSPPRYRPEDLSNLVVIEEDIIRERESMERHRMSLDKERRSVERRKEDLGRSRNLIEREEERGRRERSLERLRNMERELIERERMLNDREQRLKTPPRKRYDRDEWRPEGPDRRARSPPRRRFEEYRSRREGSRDRDRHPRSPDRGRGGSRERDRPHGWRRTGSLSPDPRRRGRDSRRSPDPKGRPEMGRDRRRFTSPSGDPARTGSASGLKPPAKIMKIDSVIVRVEDLLNDPARQQRPKRIVVILRGLPGSGKSHVAKLIRDQETSRGVTPRVLGLDDYFMVENEKFIKDPDTGKIVKKKVHEYEYEEAMEPSYRESLLRAYKKTLEDGFFTFVIVDAVNDKVAHFSEFWTIAKKMSFEVYVAELTADAHVCAKRNTHQRKVEDIQKLAGDWEKTPPHMIRLDVRQMLQDSEIQEVEMGDISDEDEAGQSKTKLTVEQMAGVPQSKWELMETNARLDKLDGIKKKKPRSSQQDMADFLSVTDDYVRRSSAPGKKRVRWADIEEKSNQRRMREVGFVVGNTDWSRMLDGDAHASMALNRTKFI